MAYRAFLRQPSPGQGWGGPAAPRTDFSYSTGLRAGELVHAALGSIEVDAHGDTWLHVVGKGSKAGAARAGAWSSGPAPCSARPPRDASEMEPRYAVARQPRWRGRHHVQAAVGDREEVLRREYPGRHPAARFLVDHVHVLALGRPLPGEADRWGVRGAGCVIGRAGRSVSICTESTRGPREAVMQVLVAVRAFCGSACQSAEKNAITPGESRRRFRDALLRPLSGARSVPHAHRKKRRGTWDGQ